LQAVLRAQRRKDRAGAINDVTGSTSIAHRVPVHAASVFGADGPAQRVVSKAGIAHAALVHDPRQGLRPVGVLMEVGPAGAVRMCDTGKAGLRIEVIAQHLSVRGRDAGQLP
jgi:hypothetical protein